MRVVVAKALAAFAIVISDAVVVLVVSEMAAYVNDDEAVGLCSAQIVVVPVVSVECLYVSATPLIDHVPVVVTAPVFEKLT